MVEAVKRKRSNDLLPGSAPMIGRHRSNALLPGSVPNLGRARSNALLPGSTERPSNPNLGNEVKNRVVPAKSRLDNAYDKVSGKLSSANDWLEGKISSADKFVQDNTFGGQSKIFNGLLGVYDKAMNLKDDFHDWTKKKKKDFHDWKDDVSEKYHNSAVGKKLDSAGSWVKGKASAAGDWIKSKLHSDKPGLMDKIKAKYEGSALQKGVNWTKDKASAAGNWIKSKFHSDKPGLMDKIKAKYEGSKLQSGVNWLKGKAHAAGDWVKDKYEGSELQKGVNYAKTGIKNIKDWAVDKKERFEDFTDDMKDKFADHNRVRRQSHKAEKKGPEYLKQLAALKMMLRNGQFAQNIAKLKDENYVMGAEQGEPQSEGFIKDKIADATANKADLFNKGMKYGVKGIGKAAKKYMSEQDWNEYGDAITGGLSAFKSFAKAGVNTASAIGLKRMKDEQITAGAANETQAANLRHAQSAMFNEQKRGAIKNAFGGVGKTIEAASSFGGPLVSTGGKIVNKITGAVGNAITGSMKASEDKHIAQESVFGDLDTYKMIKKQFPLLSTQDIQDAIAEETNSRNMGEVSNRNKMVWAQGVKETTGKGQGGYNMLKKRGYTDKGIQRISTEDIGKEMGVDMSERTMRRRLRRNQS
ncbi:MAG: hypothetical protein SPD47_04800 [Oscillospiraceae bacterium]|nr:hypothetical protein [Oscillospiraceae bacterium]